MSAQQLSNRYDGFQNTSHEKILKSRIFEIGEINFAYFSNPQEHVLSNAIKFIDAIVEHKYDKYLAVENIVPTPYGTIVFDFESSQGIVSVEIGATQIGFFTEYRYDEDRLSDGVDTDFEDVPEILLQALHVLNGPFYKKVIQNIKSKIANFGKK